MSRLSKDNKKRMCSGCRQDYYNHGNNSNTGECWSLEQSKVVTRYAIGWWVPTDSRENFTKVRVLSCYSCPGVTAFYEKIPEHLRNRY